MSMLKFRVTCYMAWVRVTSEYASARLGLFWEVLSLLFVVTFLTLVWGQVLDNSAIQSYFFYVLVGFNIWSLMSRCVDQCLTFKNRGYADLRKSVSSLEDQFIGDVLYCILQFMITAPLVFIAVISFTGFSLQGFALMLLTLLSICITAYGLISSLALISIFYEAVNRLIRMVLRVAFLMTPVLWKADMLAPNLQKYMYLNPFYSYLDVYRSALLSEQGGQYSIAVMLATTLIVFCLGQVTLRAMRAEVMNDVYLDKNVG